MTENDSEKEYPNEIDITLLSQSAFRNFVGGKNEVVVKNLHQFHPAIPRNRF